MARYFFDSSALAKRYHPEIGTPKVNSIFSEASREVQISELSFLEVQSVFAVKVRSGFITRGEAGVQRARLLVDVAAGEIDVCAMTTEIFKAAAPSGDAAFRFGCELLTPFNLRWPLIYGIKDSSTSSWYPTRRSSKWPRLRVWLY